MKRIFISIFLAALLVPSGYAVAQNQSNEALVAGDPAKGKRLYMRCRACHNLTGDQRPKLGPNLNGLFGRAAGRAEGFRYSKALQEADFIWSEEKLAQWLADPRGFLPGNRMSFAGLRKAEDRANLIAYLREATAENTKADE